MPLGIEVSLFYIWGKPLIQKSDTFMPSVTSFFSGKDGYTKKCTNESYKTRNKELHHLKVRAKNPIYIFVKKFVKKRAFNNALFSIGRGIVALTFLIDRHLRGTRGLSQSRHLGNLQTPGLGLGSYPPRSRASLFLIDTPLVPRWN